MPDDHVDDSNDMTDAAVLTIMANSHISKSGASLGGPTITEIPELISSLALPPPRMEAHALVPSSSPLSSSEAVVGSRQCYMCTFQGCTAAPFRTRSLLNTHVCVHSLAPYFCPVQGCARGEGGGIGCYSKAHLARHMYLRHGPDNGSSSYICPWCPREKRKGFIRPDNLQRYATHGVL
jgi:hypothetical protein